MARTRSPAVNYMSQGAIGCDGLLLNPRHSIWVFTVAGALTDGTAGDGATWAGTGSVAIRADTGAWYRNSGTKASPAWTEMSSA